MNLHEVQGCGDDVREQERRLVDVSLVEHTDFTALQNIHFSDGTNDERS